MRSRPTKGRGFAAVFAALGLLAAISVSPVSGGVPPSTANCFGEQPTLFAIPGGTIRGTSRDDVIAGTSVNDRIKGKGGSDLICGHKGDDTLDGGGRDDKLNGQGDEDTIRGGAGDDKHVGGPDDDIIDANTGNSAARDIAKGSDGDDLIHVADGLGNDRADGGNGTNSCTFDLGDVVNRCSRLMGRGPRPNSSIGR